MTQIALAEDGTLDRIVGDAVAVMFSAPVVQEDHAERAVRCALEMDRFASSFAARVAREHMPLRGTRIGVCSDPVIVGHVGSRTRLNYRALGDPINTTKRLEDANRYTGTRVCVAAATIVGVPDFIGPRIGLLQLAGKREPVEAWEALQHDAPQLAWLDAYHEANEQMANEDGRALDSLRSLEHEWPDDPLVRFRRQRLEAGRRGILVDLSHGRAHAQRDGSRPTAPAPLGEPTSGEAAIT